MIDLNKEVSATSADGTEIHDEQGKRPTLKSLALRALRSNHNSDANVGLKEKTERYSLVKRIAATEGQIELTSQEVNTIKERIGKIFFDVEIVGRLCELLDGKE